MDLLEWQFKFGPEVPQQVLHHPAATPSTMLRRRALKPPSGQVHNRVFDDGDPLLDLELVPLPGRRR